MNGVGRPRFQIDFDLAEKLASIQCTVEEIAHVLGCSKDTLERSEEFCGIYKKGMHIGKQSLRRKQWEAAEQGNTTMLVWLGKQYLGQHDKHDIAHTHTLTQDEWIESIQQRITASRVAAPGSDSVCSGVPTDTDKRWSH